MKYLRAIIGGALALSLQVLPVSASPASPSITLTKLGPVSASSDCSKNAAVNGGAYWDKPEIADQQGVDGAASVVIRLDQNGKLATETLYSSTGNHWLDEAALKSARMTHFNPELVDCKPVAGTYLYKIEF